MKILPLLGLAAALFTGSLTFAADTPSAPILVELFTSEGCSSCPPADLLLQQLDKSHSVPGAQMIVLSEHVDYWDHLGWKDPYSSPLATDRQAAYATHFGLASSYTPQMVADGATEFVGNNSRLAAQAIEKASHLQKVPVRISSISADAHGKLRAYVEADALPQSAKISTADVYLVVTLHHADSQVQRGENEGRHLTHVAVVQSMTKIGTADKNHSFAKQAEVPINPRTDLSNVRVIVFLQQHGPGLVLGAAMSTVPGTAQSASR